MHAVSLPLRLLQPLCISILVHALIFAPLLTFSTLPASLFAFASAPQHAPLQRPHPLPSVPPPLPLTLGIDSPSPPSLTWLGSDQPQPHVAQQADFDQAAFTDRPAPSAPLPTYSPSEPPAPISPEPSLQSPPFSSPTQPTRAQPSPTQPQFSNPANPSAPVLVPHQLTSSVEVPSIHLPPLPISTPLAPAQPQPAGTLADPPLPSDLAPPGSPAQPAPPAPEIQPPPFSTPTHAPSSASPSSPSVGTPNDADSDPTSIIDLPRDHWMLGKPLAAKGLTILPRRPTFTNLQNLTAAGANPLCLITFDASSRLPDGKFKPASAKILESSGSSEIDFAIRSSLFRWRAAGKILNELPPGKSVDLQIRLILFSR